MRVRIVRVKDVKSRSALSEPFHTGKRSPRSIQIHDRKAALAHVLAETRPGYGGEPLLVTTLAQLFRQPEDLLLPSAPTFAGIDMQNSHSGF